MSENFPQTTLDFVPSVSSLVDFFGDNQPKAWLGQCLGSTNVGFRKNTIARLGIRQAK